MKIKILLFILLMLISCLFADIVVLEEGFESGVLPPGWTQEYVIGNHDWNVTIGGYNGHPSAAHSGTYNAHFFANNTDGNTTRLITPEIALNPGSVSVLDFWFTQDDWVGCQDELKIYYKTSVEGEWILLQHYTEDIPDWTHEYITLPEVSETFWLAFEAMAVWGYGVCLDDIVVKDDVLNILIWDNDNNSYFDDMDTGQTLDCEDGIELCLDELGLEYEVSNTLPENLLEYQIVFVELGLYCVG